MRDGDGASNVGCSFKPNRRCMTCPVASLENSKALALDTAKQSPIQQTVLLPYLIWIDGIRTRNARHIGDTGEYANAGVGEFGVDYDWTQTAFFVTKGFQPESRHRPLFFEVANKLWNRV